MSESCSASLAIATVPMQQADLQNLNGKQKALDNGTVFPDLYLPFFVTETELNTGSSGTLCKLKETSESCKLLIEIMETGFYLDDLTLYLDTHPEDTEALKLYEQYDEEKKTLESNFARDYYPLCKTVLTEAKNANQIFAWTDGPAPWEGVCE